MQILLALAAILPFAAAQNADCLVYNSWTSGFFNTGQGDCTNPMNTTRVTYSYWPGQWVSPAPPVMAPTAGTTGGAWPSASTSTAAAGGSGSASSTWAAASASTTMAFNYNYFLFRRSRNERRAQNGARIIVLNLAGAGLTGTIPGSIGSLTGLQSLDLSNNQLTGYIPDSIINLKHLMHINLSGDYLQVDANVLKWLTSLPPGSVTATGTCIPGVANRPPTCPVDTSFEKCSFVADEGYVFQDPSFNGAWAAYNSQSSYTSLENTVTPTSDDPNIAEYKFQQFQHYTNKVRHCVKIAPQFQYVWKVGGGTTAFMNVKDVIANDEMSAQ